MIIFLQPEWVRFLSREAEAMLKRLGFQLGGALSCDGEAWLGLTVTGDQKGPTIEATATVTQYSRPVLVHVVLPAAALPDGKCETEEH